MVYFDCSLANNERDIAGKKRKGKKEEKKMKGNMSVHSMMLCVYGYRYKYRYRRVEMHAGMYVYGCRS